MKAVYFIIISFWLVTTAGLFVLSLNRNGTYINYKIVYWSLFGSALIFSLLFEPNESSEAFDLFRYYYAVDALRGNDIEWAFKFGEYRFQPVINLYLWINSLIETKVFLSFSLFLIESLLIFFIFNHLFDKDKGEQKGEIAQGLVLFFFLTFGLLMPLSIIRCSLAISLFLFGLINECLDKNRRNVNVIFYVLSCLCHYIGVILLLLRILVSFSKSIRIVTMFLLAICYIYYDILADLLLLIGGDYCTDFAERILIYRSRFSIFEIDGGVNVVMHCMRVALLLWFLYVLLIYFKRHIKIKCGNKKVLDFSLMAVVFSLICFDNFILIERMMMIISLLLVYCLYCFSDKIVTGNLFRFQLMLLNVFGIGYFLIDVVNPLRFDILSVPIK